MITLPSKDSSTDSRHDDINFEKNKKKGEKTNDEKGNTKRHTRRLVRKQYYSKMRVWLYNKKFMNFSRRYGRCSKWNMIVPKERIDHIKRRNAHLEKENKKVNLKLSELEELNKLLSESIESIKNDAEKRIELARLSTNDGSDVTVE